jgi:AcrR family transcriptional regulator
MPTKSGAPSKETAPRPHSGASVLASSDSGRSNAGQTLAPSPSSGAGGLGAERVVEIQRSRMLAAMVEVSCEHGASNVTVAHVVERAGVSRRTFYELFDDREECLLAAFDDAVGRASRYVLDAYVLDVSWAERIRSALAALLEFLDVERGAGQLLIVGSLGAGAKALEHRRRILAQIIAVVEEGSALTGTGREARPGKRSVGDEQPPSLTAEGIVGGALAILHARLSEDREKSSSLLELTGPLMSMIVLPYLGPAASRRELERSVPKRRMAAPSANGNPLRELQMRLTYRTVRVLLAVAAQPGGSNRQVADAAGITDQGQISKLLARLHGLGLIENTAASPARGAPNAWTLTAKGWDVEAAIARDVTPGDGT